MDAVADRTYSTVVLHIGKQYRASEKLVVEKALRSRPGVIEVEANPAAQTATVTYDARLASVKELRRVVEECGFDCAGCNVPGCCCDPLQEPTSRNSRLTTMR
jgi:Cu2+-exporting ATPase